MPIAAVPKYLGENFDHASPGMRFGMYLKLWGINLRTQELLWKTHDIDYEVKGAQKQEREIKKETKTSSLNLAKKLNDNDQKILKALFARQCAAFQSLPASAECLCLDAISTAPFTTGLGNEHPLENGFAFLNPYGLPYLPGSGWKGVLRQAARELAEGEWGDSQGWTEAPIYSIQVGNQTVKLSPIDALFGLQSDDGDTQHIRGALTFWDVIPQIEGNSLSVDVMTPHQGHYYQKDPKKTDSITPHDSGTPIPISFLTVPAGTRFAFYVQCDHAHLEWLAPDLAENERWKDMLKALFEHAFEWLGFGAKTAVGYGAMESEEQRARKQQAVKQRKQEEKVRQDAEAMERRLANAQPWPGARIKFNRANGTLSVEKSGKTVYAIAPEGEKLLKTLPSAIQQKIRENQFVKVTAYVAEDVLIRVEAT